MYLSSITTPLPLPYFRIKLITLLYPGQMFPSRCNRGSERWCGVTIRRNLEHTLCNRVNALTNDPLLNPDSDISSNSSGRRSNGFESSSTRFTSSTLPSSPLCPFSSFTPSPRSLSSLLFFSTVSFAVSVPLLYRYLFHTLHFPSFHLH